jgi:hypothetical protein
VGQRRGNAPHGSGCELVGRRRAQVGERGTFFEQPAHGTSGFEDFWVPRLALDACPIAAIGTVNYDWLHPIKRTPMRETLEGPSQ